jgi:hypothetical protein
MGICLACALALIVLKILRNKQGVTDLEASSIQEKQSSLTSRPSKSNAKREGLIPPQSLGMLAETQNGSAEALASSEVEAILEQTDLSFEESATRLLDCVRREDLPMQVRLDALDHAFNLDRWQALTLCMEKPLAKPIAERLLSGIYNQGESPKDQVAAAMHLVLHEDEEIREQARELLAFLVSAEEHASDPEKLREAADAFLKIPLGKEKVEAADDGSE